ncbi:MAG TPA: VOC family protein [Polyangiaceae bacterium]|nr:VOC family protein [Polyangiaceae bacterium]
MTEHSAAFVAAVTLALGVVNVGCQNESADQGLVVDDAGPRPKAKGLNGNDAAAMGHPYVRAGGIGVTDLDGASTFLTSVLGMSREGADVTRPDRVERTFFAKQAARGSRVVLMKFNDGRNTKDITAKIVFEAADVQATYDAAVAAGYPSILAPISLGNGVLVSQVKGPEGYTVEILNGLDPGGAGIASPYFIALAFGVGDFMASRKFYADALGMVETTPYSDSDLMEQTMEYPNGGGAGLVLQHYSMSMHQYENNPVKHVSYVPDVNAFAKRIQSAGGTLVQAPAAMPAYGGRTGAVLADPDGVVIEIVAE